MDNNESTSQEFLSQNVVLLCPTISAWKGFYQLPSEKTRTFVSEEAIDSGEITTPRAKLLTDTYPVDRRGVAWKKRFQKVDAGLTRLKDQYSVRFPINGVRVVPKNKVAQFLHLLYGETVGGLARQRDSLLESAAYSERAQLDDVNERFERVKHLPPSTPLFDPSRETQSLAYELWQTATEFCDNLDDVWKQIADHSNVWAQVNERIPRDRKSMMSKFSLDVVRIELASDTATLGSTEDLLAQSDVVRDTCRRRVSEAIEEMISEPRNMLADALANLHELISRDGKVSEKSFGPVRNAIAKIRLFDCVADDALLEKMTELENRLDGTVAKTLTSTTAASNGFSSAIDAFRNEVLTAEARVAASARFDGRSPRALSMAS